VVWIAVAVGGALGSVARHFVNHLATRWPAFPVGTVVVNVSGSFIIGLLAGLVVSKRLQLDFYGREFLFVGVLGGFTTFSSFSLETLVLARTHPGHAAVNVGVQVVGSLVGVWLGYRAGTMLT
jgi:CrcB protein